MAAAADGGANKVRRRQPLCRKARVPVRQRGRRVHSRSLEHVAHLQYETVSPVCVVKKGKFEN